MNPTHPYSRDPHRVARRPVGAWLRPRASLPHLALAVLLGLPVALVGQIPTQGGVGAGTIRAEYIAYLMEGANELLDDWGEAWARDDLEMGRYYNDRATLVVPGEWTRRRGEVVDGYLDRLLPTVGRVELGIAQVDGSDRIGVFLGRYRLNGIVSATGGSTDEGHHITVLWQDNWDWEIRSQLFVSDADGVPSLWWQGAGTEPEPVLSSRNAEGGPGGGFSYASLTLSRFADAWTRADLEAFRDVITEDVTLRGPGCEYLVGREEVLLRLWGGGFGFGSDLRMAPVDFVTSGDLAVLLGRFVITGSELEDGNRSGPFAVVLLFERDDWVVRTLLFAPPG